MSASGHSVEKKDAPGSQSGTHRYQVTGAPVTQGRGWGVGNRAGKGAGLGSRGQLELLEPEGLWLGTCSPRRVTLQEGGEPGGPGRPRAGREQAGCVHRRTPCLVGSFPRGREG